MIQKIVNTQVPKYEVLDYIITPSRSSINTEVLVDGSTVVEMTVTLTQSATNSPRFFSSNDTNTDSPGWKEPGTWGLQFEDSGNTLSIKVLGNTTLSDPVIRTNITYNDLSGSKYRYNLTAAGILNIYDTSDNVYKSYDVTQYTDTSYISSTPIKLFHRYASHEYINNGTYVYDVKIWQNNTLIRHYVPVKRLSDNVYGLYDLENETFHPNEVSGYSFSGVSKSTPEYIYDNLSQTNYVNSINMYVSQPQHVYEVLDYISTSQQQYLDTDIVAQNGIKVEMTTKLTSRPGNTRLWSTHDPRDYSGQNWAFASGAWGLQFEGSQMCIKPLGTSANNINSFDLLSYYFNNVQNKKLRYELACSGLLEIYDDTDTLVYTFDSSAKTDLNKVSHTTIRFFGREATERAEWMVGDTYDIKIYDNGTLIRHYIPVKRMSDNVIGFYETETETFLTSASGTIFSGTSKATPEYIDRTVSQTININKIYLNGEVYWGGDSVTPPIPQTPTYEILEEIHAPDSSTAQCCIDTLYIPKQNSYFEMTYKCRFTTTQGTYGAPRLFAASSGIYGITGLFGAASYEVDYENNTMYIKLNGMTNWWRNSGITIDDTDIHTVAVGLNLFYYDGTKIGNFTYSWNSSNTTVSMKINTEDASNSTGHYNIYAFNIYEGNYGSGTKVMELIPVKRLSDNAIGMYDNIGHTFYSSRGTDIFVATSKSIPEYIYE